MRGHTVSGRKREMRRIRGTGPAALLGRTWRSEKPGWVKSETALSWAGEKGEGNGQRGRKEKRPGGLTGLGRADSFSIFYFQTPLNYLNSNKF